MSIIEHNIFAKLLNVYFMLAIFDIFDKINFSQEIILYI